MSHQMQIVIYQHSIPILFNVFILNPLSLNPLFRQPLMQYTDINTAKPQDSHH